MSMSEPSADKTSDVKADNTGESKRSTTDEINLFVVPGYILGGIILLFLICVSYRLQETEPQRFFNMLLIPFGGVLGWAVGILLSPRGQPEVQQFQALSQALGTFISGFLLAKLAPIFEKAASDSSRWTATNGVRSMLLVVSFFLGVVFVYVGRTRGVRPRTST
jgi:hypothetical protein